MNDNIQNKKNMMKELETLLSGEKNITISAYEELATYCECMKQFYLSCSTNN